MDFISSSKILPLLIYPFNVALWLMIIALVLLWLQWVRAAGACLAVAIAIFLVTGNPTLATALYAHHERTHLPLPVADYPRVDAIIALGGSLGPPLPPRLSPELYSSADRLLHAARLYHAGRAPRVILAGGNVFPQPGIEEESFYAAKLLEEWGVPASAILIEDQSRNTYQNAVNTKKLVDKNGIGKVLLVTSAIHMPRALAVFRSNGIDALPAPTDYAIVGQNEPELLSWLPSIGSVQAVTGVIHENLGLLVYRYKGWIKSEASQPEKT